MSHALLNLCEGEYCLRNLLTEQDFLQAFRLRHQVFSEALGWVEPRPDALEIDEYDAWGVPLGVFRDGERLVAYLRILPPHAPFMLERDFAVLVPADCRLRKSPDTSEVTRLTTIAFRDRSAASQHLSLLAYKALYQWSVLNRIRYAYFVVEKAYFRCLRMTGFPCEPLGPARILNGGVASVAVVLDWQRFRIENQARRPAFFHWIATARSVPGAGPTPPHESAWMPPASPWHCGYGTSPFAR